MFFSLLFDQQQLLSILILLPFISFSALFFCAKSRPSKDLAAAPPAKKKTSKVKKEEVKEVAAAPKPTKQQHQQPSKKNVIVKEAEEVKKVSSKENEEKNHEKLKVSKTGSSDDAKKAQATVAKGSNENNVKPSEHVASELRKGHKPAGMKGSHEVEGKKVGSHEVAAVVAGKKGGSHEVLAAGSKDKVPNEYDLHRSQTPAIFPEDEEKKTNFTGSILEYNNVDTDGDGGHLKKGTTEDDEKLKTLKPRIFEKNEKEKRIVAGEKRKSSEYPTMADVLSDWTDQPKSQPVPDSLLSEKKVEPI